MGKNWWRGKRENFTLLRDEGYWLWISVLGDNFAGAILIEYQRGHH